MTSAEGAQRRAVSLARRVARRPRSMFAAVRDHRSTQAAAGTSRRTFERAALARRAAADRKQRSADWARLLADLEALPAAPPLERSVVTVAIERGETAAAAVARTAGTDDADLLCLMLTSTTAIEPGWLARLAEAVDGTTVAAAVPTVVHPLRKPSRATPHDGRVRAIGLTVDVDDDAPVLRARRAGAAPTASAGPSVPVEGATAACVVVDRRAFDAAGGVTETADPDIACYELARVLRERGARVVAVPGAVVVDPRPVRTRRSLDEPVPTGTIAWRGYVDAHGPALLRAASPLAPGSLRIAITVAAPSEKVAPRWGDWHLAHAFARSLRKLGHVVRVQTFDRSDDLPVRASDVHVVVRGLRSVRRTPGQAHVLWVISHPEHVSARECDDADLVLVASTRFADELQTRTRTPVEVMLQATDIERFNPRVPDPHHTHDVAVVAKSRDVFRPAVEAAIEAGLRPAIYGSGWERFVDTDLLVTDYVANDELPVVYSSVGVLLTDHWESMNAWGFVSNRLFDALACETTVISEDLPEVDELFEGTVLTFRNAADLRAVVDAALTDRPAARARAAHGRALVVERHTFDHRAAQFLDALRRHGLDRAG